MQLDQPSRAFFLLDGFVGFRLGLHQQNALQLSRALSARQPTLTCVQIRWQD